MDLFNMIKGIFEKEYVSVYCQTCGKDITLKGGRVTENGNSYCRDSECVFEAVSNRVEKRIITGDYCGSRRLQKLIRKGELIHYFLKE